MPSLNEYKKILGSRNNGETRKYDSDMIMEATFDEDLETQTMYFYDYYHDFFTGKLNDLHPEKDRNKIPCRAKFMKHTSKTMDKDAVTYHLMLKPSQEIFVNYYQDYINMYDSTFPVGLYVDVKDSKGRYNKWLVVDVADFSDLQFPTYELLRCDYVLQYMMDGKKKQISAVLRSQNSYNSGIWTNYKVTSVEDQQKFALPLNRETEKIYYTEGGQNLRMIIDGNVLTEPRTWKVTKVNRIAPNGITRVTLAQDKFDSHTDYIEFDNFGKVIGKWADFFSDINLPQEPPVLPQTFIHGEFKWSALPQLKVGGSYKKFTVSFFKNEEEISIPSGKYTFTIDGSDASSLLSVIQDGNILKVRFDGDDTWIGKKLKIEYVTSKQVIASVDVEIVGL